MPILYQYQTAPRVWPQRRCKHLQPLRRTGWSGDAEGRRKRCGRRGGGGLVACVVEPFHAGLGGRAAFVTYYDKASGQVHTYDARMSSLLRPTGYVPG